MKVLAFILLLLPPVSFGASVVRTLDAPDTSICGLAWGEGMLWCLDDISSWVYGLNPETGDVEVSFEFSGYMDYTPAGLAYNDGTLYGSFINGTESTRVYWYSTSGTLEGSYDLC
ncbi:MAG: hypothetical protein KAS73_13500 [Candidatus Sabulitectum sp.]|nr:hypothetical protein [Candidatus Sabulitectum sp.]